MVWIYLAVSSRMLVGCKREETSTKHCLCTGTLDRRKVCLPELQPALYRFLQQVGRFMEPPLAIGLPP